MSSESLPTVWVVTCESPTVEAATPQTAYLVQEAGLNPREPNWNQCLVQWTSTLELEWVPRQRIKHQPPPASKKRVRHKTNHKDHHRSNNKKPARVSLEKATAPLSSSSEELDANNSDSPTNGLYPFDHDDDDENDEDRVATGGRFLNGRQLTALKDALDNTEDVESCTAMTAKEAMRAQVANDKDDSFHDNSTAQKDDRRDKEEQDDNNVHDAEDGEVEFLWTLAPSPPRRRPPETQHSIASAASVEAQATRNDAIRNSAQTNIKLASSPCTETGKGEGSSLLVLHTLKSMSERDTEMPPTGDSPRSTGGGGDNNGRKDPPVTQDSKIENASINSANLPMGQHPSPPSPYLLVQSAYVQTLAEMAYTILNDARWRVGRHGGGGGGGMTRCLLGWENRDEDLTALALLQRLYRPPLHHRKPVAVDCSCLLCQRKQQSKPAESNDEMKDAAQQTEGNEIGSSSSESVPQQNYLDGSNVGDKDDDDDDSVRWLYLYCRLFYRRGPWFRLDDIYERYYRPKGDDGSFGSRSSSNDTPTISNDDDDDDNVDEAVEEKNSTSDSVLESSTTNAGNQTSAQNKVVFGADALPVHLSRAEEMFRDLDKLASSGLIRSFDGEEECGITVGQSVLTQDMRTALLGKLGIKHTNRSNNSNMKKNSIQQQQSTTNGKATTNHVWRQMNRQQSILAALGNNGNSATMFPEKSKQLLPVMKHVNSLVLEKLALDILKSCCGLSPTAIGSAGYVPSAIRKSQGAILLNLQRLVQQCDVLSRHQNSHNNNNNNVSFACWRLRETPALCLRRCCRLYLCATSGPGDMRGDESNGWKSLQDIGYRSYKKNQDTLINVFPLSNRIQPPGLHTWCHVQYPGSMVRFGLTSAMFQRAYRPILATNTSNCAVFSSLASFHAWEMCVELRANVDYLLALHDLMRYETRQHERRLRSRNSEAGYFSSTASSSNNTNRRIGNQQGGGGFESVDFLKIQTTNGLDSILRTFLATFKLSPEQAMSRAISVRKSVGSDLDQLLTASSQGECERILITLATAIVHLLQTRIETIGKEEADRMISMPWLRHLWWEGCLAYILWDIIPILERAEMYSHAIRCLHVLLYGSAHDKRNDEQPDFDSCGAANHPLAVILLSRRARGKALDRLVIDQTHLHRQLNNQNNTDGEKSSEVARTKQKSAREAAAMRSTRMCEKILQVAVPTGQITFSAIRGIARRLKLPLSDTLRNTKNCLEARELGLRLESSENDSAKSSVENGVGNRYTDWTPHTDKTVANAIASDEAVQGAGSRCSYIGHEDGSLNVEQLAMEYYRLGSLPACNSDVEATIESIKGGWVGWHDEGGHIRAIFRILCSAPLLGIDWGCSSDLSNHEGHLETIHLSPYQGAPFDLHVGFALQPQPAWEGFAEEEAVPSFYQRQRSRIEAYLTELAMTSPQGICHAIYDSIACRLTYAAKTAQRDPLLSRDVQNLRTLSMIAAGCGGKQLASIFRCLLFDYRHYSGGLPDLLLVRARYVQCFSSEPQPGLVDLSDWVGETLSKQYQEQQDAIRGVAMIADEEFLGCSKVGDSGGGGGGSRGTRGQRRVGNPRKPSPPPSILLELPERLELSHNGVEVVPECMMVEVKSSNDRLDGRQEDWLNILDRNGNARVCKFESTSTKMAKKISHDSRSMQED